MVSVLRSRVSLHLEVLALRHQLAILQEARQRPRLKPADSLGTSGHVPSASTAAGPARIVTWQGDEES